MMSLLHRTVCSFMPQFITGCIGMCSVELVVDYFIKHEAQYTGGIFWVDCTCDESISAGLQSIAEVSELMYWCVYSSTDSGMCCGYCTWNEYRIHVVQ